jgi:hypothetical protein
MELVSTGELLANLVPALRFRPTDSLILAPMAGDELLGVIRMDLKDAFDDRAAGQLADVTASCGADGVVVVFVSEASAHCVMCAQQFSDISRALAAELAGHGARLRDALVVDRLDEAGQWRSLIDPDVAGEVGDPRAALLAADAVLSGRPIYSSRDEALQSLAVEPALAAAVAEEADDDIVGVDLVESVRLAVQLAERVAAGETPSAAELAAMGRALQVAEVVEVLFTLADSRLARPAETLWTVLARSLAPAERAEALVLTGASRYLRGDGVLAQIAFEAALSEVPDHEMALLFQTALNNAIHPRKIRELFDDVPSALTV